jgi:D-sedoheptulose 7-phosphate isomerase
MDNNAISLDARTLEFHTLLSRSEFTLAEGKSVDIEAGMQHAMALLATARDQGNAVYLVGNGGSASIASHATVDFMNVAKLRALTVHDAALLTCMSNDHGYENGYSRIMGHLARKHDVLIAISSSGNSANIRNAATTVTQAGGTVITLSGFDSQNPLRRLGQLNIWLDSRDYGMVEIGHQFILHNLADRFGRQHGAR